jgi:hypothetical protein
MNSSCARIHGDSSQTRTRSFRCVNLTDRERGEGSGAIFSETFGATHHGLGASKRDGVGDRARPGSHRMAIVAALNDPLAVFLADNFSDVMPPDNDGADRRSAGVRAIAGPGSRQIVGRAGIAADLAAHVPAAPGLGAPGMMLIAVVAG